MTKIYFVAIVKTTIYVNCYLDIVLFDFIYVYHRYRFNNISPWKNKCIQTLKIQKRYQIFKRDYI